LQDSFWLLQLAKQASAAASAIRNLPLPIVRAFAAATPISDVTIAMLSRNFIGASGMWTFIGDQDRRAGD
jgi:hypothetical protein